jgi:ankyrin repeat protein
VTELLRSFGGDTRSSEVDLFLAACAAGDRSAARRAVEEKRVDVQRLSAADCAVLVRAAETGNAAAVELMLDLGFPIDARGEDGGTALHAAAYHGSAEVVRLLVRRGAHLDARDSSWDDTPLGWALVGSGERPSTNSDPDWVDSVQALLDAGASLEGVTLSADAAKPPSDEVAGLLRMHGVPDVAPDA